MFRITDVDECRNGFSNCSQREDCLNTDGSFTCVCSDGYTRVNRTCAGTHSFLITCTLIYITKANSLDSCPLKVFGILNARGRGYDNSIGKPCRVGCDLSLIHLVRKERLCVKNLFDHVPRKQLDASLDMII